MKKRVWILNHHANVMFFDNGGRHYFFAKYLKENGYEPVIFCSNAEHGTGNAYFDEDDIWHEHINENINVPFIFVKGRVYSRNDINRIKCMFDYYHNVKKAVREYSILHGKPDVIIGSQVHPLAVLAGEQLAKEYGIKCIAEFKDLWPESLVALGIAKKYNPVILAMRLLEKKLYEDADAILFSMEGGFDYIVERGWDKRISKEKSYYINNGVDLETFRYNEKNSNYNDKDLEDAVFKVIYTGSIRRANGLDELIKSAILLKDNFRIRFLIYGDGDYKSELEAMIKKNRANNVVFKGRVKKQDIPYILSKSNLNVLDFPVVAAEAGLYRFGASQNKLFDYLASGKPILSVYTTPYDIVKRYDCGISKKLITAEQYVTAINEIVNCNEERYREMCENALEAAKDFDYKCLAKQLMHIIESI